MADNAPENVKAFNLNEFREDSDLAYDGGSSDGTGGSEDEKDTDDDSSEMDYEDPDWNADLI